MTKDHEIECTAINYDMRILVTGARGFLGKWVVSKLLEHGFTKIRCLVRPSLIKPTPGLFPGAEAEDPRVEFAEGNLLSREDCINISKDMDIIYHLAAGRGEKSFPSAYLNSVVTTRNLLDASLKNACLQRFVNVSSFTVYSNCDKPKRRLLDESCPIEKSPAERGSAYCFAKAKQEEMLFNYARDFGLKYVNLRPGVVYGPGNEQVHIRVGTGMFGIFLHLGGSNRIPLTYVENCAEAIVLAGISKVSDNESYNIIDDDLPSSRRFLRLYKKNVKWFPSVHVPHTVSYAFCYLWEKYSSWSQGQLPNRFNRKEWHAMWKKTYYSNLKLKQVGWRQKTPTGLGLQRCFQSCRGKNHHV